MELERPPAAAAALAGVFAANNCEYTIYDLNLDLYNSLANEDWAVCDRKWRVDQEILLPASFDLWFKDTVSKIINNDHDMIAVSVFSKFSTRFALMLLQELRSKISVTFIVGGQGLSSPWGDTTFGKLLVEHKLVDHIAVGDGEVILDRFLKGGRNIPGLDGIPPEQVSNLDEIPYPKYDQIEPTMYHYHQHPGVYVTASRGCVRKCKFCDVPHRWPKYKYRRGTDIAKQIYQHYKDTGATLVQFTDSVINGNVSEFEKLQLALIDFKKTDANFKPKWISQFNIRKKRDMPEHIYSAMADAGASVLVCGVEHASWSIRESMGKEFDNEDLDYHIRMCAKYGISNVFLMFIGYPTETLDDHNEMLLFLEKYQKYMFAGTIMTVRWGYTGSLDHGSKLELMQDQLEIIPEWPDLKIMTVDDQTQDWLYGRNWVNLNNPTLTFKERMRRRLEVHERSIDLGYPVTRAREELEILKIMCEAFYADKPAQVFEIKDIGDH